MCIRNIRNILLRHTFEVAKASITCTAVAKFLSRLPERQSRLLQGVHSRAGPHDVEVHVGLVLPCMLDTRRAFVSFPVGCLAFFSEVAG